MKLTLALTARLLPAAASEHTQSSPFYRDIRSLSTVNIGLLRFPDNSCHDLFLFWANPESLQAQVDKAKGVRVESRWIERFERPGRTVPKYSRILILSLRQLSTTDKIAAIFGPACGLPM